MADYMCNSYSEMDFNARVDVNVDVHVQIDGKLDAVSHLQLRKTRSNNKKKKSMKMVKLTVILEINFYD